MKQDPFILDRPWGRMACADTGGAGTPLIFLHGSGCDSDDWPETFEHLPTNVRAMTMDFPAHGRSDVPSGPFFFEGLADDVIALADHRELSEMILVGHSLGGMVALATARRDGRTRALVLLEGWTNQAGTSAFNDPSHMYGHLAKDHITRIKRKNRRTIARFEPKVHQAYWKSVMQADAWKYLGNATIPVVEVFGSVGRIDDAEQRLAPENPNIHWVWIEDAGHYLPHERPRETAEACRLAMELSAS